MFDCIVVGAGINGLCTAWAVARTGARVALLDARPQGHTEGSSHGATRITRTGYHDPLFARLAVRAHGVDWPDLASDLGRTLVSPSPGLLFGPPGPVFERYLEVASAAQGGVHEVDPAWAAERFPQVRLEGCRALVDPSAGVVAAGEVVAGLRAWLAARCTVLQCRVLAVEREGVAVRTDAGRITARAIAVCAGPWAPALIPELRVVPVRQTVGFVRLPSPSPVWIRLDDPLWYGLPDPERGCWKLARHRTSGTPDDPDASAGPADADEIRAFAARQFRGAAELVAIERCFYTNTPTEDFVLDTLPDQPRIAVGSACSGHAFKFAPLTGRIMSSLLGFGAPIPEHEAARARFAL